jgi:hypothetical protein
MDTKFLYDVTKVYRKGDVVTERNENGLHVTEVFGYPHVSNADTEALIDVHFVWIAVDVPEAEKHADEFDRLLHDYPQPNRLQQGPSYIELGAVLGDQELAFRFIAVGAALRRWTVIIPETLGITGPEAAALAGSGMVMLSPFHLDPVDV